MKKKLIFCLLGTLALLGVAIAFILPNLVEVRISSSTSEAISRAESCNMAIASYIQSVGKTEAITVWNQTKSNQERYTLISPFLSFAPETFAEYSPSCPKFTYEIKLYQKLFPLQKVALYCNNKPISY